MGKCSQAMNDWQAFRAAGADTGLKKKTGSYISKVLMVGHLRSERLINQTTSYTGNMPGSPGLDKATQLPKILHQSLHVRKPFWASNRKHGEEL